MTEPADDRRDPDSRKRESSYSYGSTASACSTIINIYSIEVDDLLEGPPEGEHGGELETSLLLHLAPDRVRTELIADFIPDPRTFRRYVRGRVPTPPPGSRGTVGRPTLVS